MMPSSTTTGLPPFPASALSEWHRSFVIETARFVQVPRDLVALTSLPLLAMTVARKVIVVVRPGYSEPLTLWTMTVAGSGERKSPVVAAAVAPIEEVEALLLARYNAAAPPEIEALDIADRLDRIALDDGEVRPEWATHDEVVERELRRHLASIDGDDELDPRLLVDDATPEKLAVFLAEHGRIAMISAEAGIFGLLTRSARAGAENIDVFLKAYSGEAIRVDRKGSPRPLIARRPALTIGLTAQPSLLRAIGQNEAFRGRGLMARFLYGVPTSRVGARIIDVQPIDASIERAYAFGVRAMLGLSWRDGDRPHELHLSIEALNERDVFAQRIESGLRPFGRLEGISDWANKLPGQVARLGGILHLADLAPTIRETAYRTPISGDVMRRAVMIGRYAIEHALRAHDIMAGLTAAEDDARTVLRVMRQRGLTRIRLDEAVVNLRGAVGGQPAVRAAFGELVRVGRLRLVDVGGRVPTYEVVPERRTP